MSKINLINIHNEIEDLITTLNTLGYDSNRGCVQALVEAQGFLDDEIDFLEEEE